MSRIAGLLSTLLFTLILAGCNTLTVDISVPDVITQHEPFTYEAEADPDAVGQIAYEWSLDGSIVSSLPIDNALIATAGEHTLSVKITDEEGETGEAEVTLDVLPAEILNADFAVNVELLNMEEAPLENVTVTIPAQDPWQNEIEWYSDIVQTGEVDATKKTTPGGFFLSINAMTNIFNATGNLTTVIDGKKYTQPANGT